MRFWIIICGFLTLLACESRLSLAPVSERSWREQRNHTHIHQVRRGETLYSIAFGYDLDYRQLARYNHLYPPYALRVGQRLSLTERRPVYRPVSRRMPVPHYPVSHALSARGTRFIWPAQGCVIRVFSPQHGQKGIDIQGKANQAVYAAAPGIVAYAGSGLQGYGNLIIIKHSGQYLTAYGNNARNRVREGQHVVAGQMIAEMGRLERRSWGVHFEIRHAGQPINPLRYLRHR